MAIIILFLALILASAPTVAAPLPERSAGEHGVMKPQTITSKGNESIDSISPLDKYIFLKKLGSGFFGEAWMVRARDSNTDVLAIKKIHKQIAGYSNFRQSGLREIHFGQLISKISVEGKKHIAGFVESFSHREELYIVSQYGGDTLAQFIYKRSSWWRWIRETDNGRQQMKDIIFQLLTAVQFLHKNGITHRDLKPSNMVMCFQNQEGSCSTARDADFTKLYLRVIDFGNALDEFSTSNLYGSDGPSRAEQDFLYMPPEAINDDSWIMGSSESTSKYDTWTVGQVILELIMGTPFVFKTARPAVSFDTTETDMVLDRVIAPSRFCIDIPWANLGDSKCTDEEFSEIIKSKDPLRLGFPDVLLLQLARQLLAGDPDKRVTAEAALQHRYFQQVNTYSEDDVEL